MDGVREAWRAISANDFEGFIARVHPEAEFTSLVAEAEAVTYRGHEGVEQWWSAVHEAFPEFWADVIDLRDFGDQVLAEIRLCGRVHGTTVEQTIWQVLTVSEGLVTCWSIYRSEEEALRAIARIERSARL